MLRDYQRRLLSQVNEALAEANSVVMQMPTGAGKTITAAEMIRTESAKGPVWFVCHRREIIRQASHTLSNLGVRHDVIAPRPDKMNLGFGYTPGAAVSIASVQTLARRTVEEAPRLIIWDECHHAAARTWSSIIHSLPETKHVGLTATPERTDGKGLKDWFASLVCGPSISNLIEQGHLARLRVFAPTIPDMSAARLAMGDYRKDDADAVMNTPVLIGSAVDEYQRHAPGSRAILFATSREASKAAADRFNAAGIPAQHVDAFTSVDERDAAIQSLGSGRLRVLTNVEVFTEGVDVPGIETVIMMRPTRSLTLYLQMIGRGMRVTGGSDVLTVLDHSGNIFEHDIPGRVEWEWSVEGRARRSREKSVRHDGEAIRRCPKCHHTHTIAPTCGECGYVYPSGREVGEFDGLLRESSVGSGPSSHVSIGIASRLTGISQTSIRRAINAGCPYDEWGMPRGAGLEWLREKWHPPQSPPRDVDDPSAFVPRSEIVRRYPIKFETLARILSEGKVVVARNGWVNETQIRIEIEKRSTAKSDRRVKAQGVSDGEMYATKWADDRGHTYGALKRMLKAGLPHRTSGAKERPHLFVEENAADQWVREKWREPASPLRPPENGGGENYLSGTRFCLLFSSSVKQAGRKLTDLKRRGLPTAENGWVHVRSGLEWVREHTSYQIPPEAWPDREEANKMAAE